MRWQDIGATLFGLTLAMALNPTQAAGQQPAKPRPVVRNSNEVVTLVGCVEPEAAYRKRVNDGKGGALGTGLGVENEYVLTDVRTPEAIAKNAEVGTAGTASVYGVTGRLEKELKESVGHAIEVVGFVENAGAAGSEVTDLPRVKVNVWHPVSNTCPAR
jgi:hypothetical protein